MLFYLFDNKYIRHGTNGLLLEKLTLIRCADCRVFCSSANILDSNWMPESFTRCWNQAAGQIWLSSSSHAASLTCGWSAVQHYAHAGASQLTVVASPGNRCVAEGYCSIKTTSISYSHGCQCVIVISHLRTVLLDALETIQSFAIRGYLLRHRLSGGGQKSKLKQPRWLKLLSNI